MSSPYGNETAQLNYIERPVMEPLDENNSIIQDLMNAGYSLEKSINAVKKCETLNAAFDYLQGEDDDTKGEEEVDRKFIREDSEDSEDSVW